MYGRILEQSSLSILTWKSPLTLRATLESLKPIADSFGDKLILCQTGDPCEIALAKEYGYRAETTSENLGILGGLKRAVSLAKFNTVLMLENDAQYFGEPHDLTALSQAADALQNTDLSFACFIDRRHGPRPRYYKFWKKTWPPKPRFSARIRPVEANSIKADGLSLATEAIQSCDFAEAVGHGLWRTTSKYFPWSNRAKFVRKDFFLESLIPFAEAHAHSRTVNGLLDLEYQINAPQQRDWYRHQNFSLLIHIPGLFGHTRYDRPSDDEKWETGLPVTKFESAPSTG